MFFSYQKQALTVLISPLCTYCHDKKGKLNGEMIGKIWKKYDQIWKGWKKNKLNSEKI
jgi:hypothetical protein